MITSIIEEKELPEKKPYPVLIPVILRELEVLGFDVSNLNPTVIHGLFLTKRDCSRGLIRWLDEGCPNPKGKDGLQVVRSGVEIKEAQDKENNELQIKLGNSLVELEKLRKDIVTLQYDRADLITKLRNAEKERLTSVGSMFKRWISNIFA